MDERRLELYAVDGIIAESFGEPGSRTFRLLVKTEHGSVSLWLEKQQLAMLGAAITELLERTADVEPAAERSVSIGSGVVGDIEVHVGSLALGFDAEMRTISLEASDFTSAFELSSIHVLGNRNQFTALGVEITDIVSRSRPRCTLCGQPLSDGPHFCPESNGHSRAGYAE